MDELPSAHEEQEYGARPRIHKGPLIIGSLSSVLSRANEESGSWFLMAYLGILAVMFLIQLVGEVNALTLCAELGILTCHAIVVFIVFMSKHLCRQREMSRLSPVALSIALCLETLLFALADPLVQLEASEHKQAGKVLNALAQAPSMDDVESMHPYRSTFLFQFHFVYHALFVLKFAQASILLPLCWLFYSIILMTVYGRENYVDDLTLKDQEIYVCLGIVGLMLAAVLTAKRLQEALQKPLLNEFENRALFQVRELHANSIAKGADQSFGATPETPTHTSPHTPRVVEQHRTFCIAGSGQFSSAHQLLLGPCDGTGQFSIVSRGSVPAVAHFATVPAGRSIAFAHMQPEPLCEAGDCLPSDTLVWIENESIARTLGSVSAEEKVLCYDNVAGMMKYCPLESIQPANVNHHKGSVTIGLSDGTVLEMTADHPMECYPANSCSGEAPLQARGHQKCVRAEDLTVGQDGVLVLQQRILPVSSVSRNAPAALDPTANRDWVNICVQQPQRHTIFAMQGKNKMAASQMMAVGPSNMQPSMQETTVSNTFLHVKEDHGGSVARVSSCPPAMRRGGREAKSALPSKALPDYNDNRQTLEKPAAPQILGLGDLVGQENKYGMPTALRGKSMEDDDYFDDGSDYGGMNTMSTQAYTHDKDSTTNSQSQSRTASESDGHPPSLDVGIGGQATSARNKRRRLKQRERRRAAQDGSDANNAEPDESEDREWSMAL